MEQYEVRGITQPTCPASWVNIYLTYTAVIPTGESFLSLNNDDGEARGCSARSVPICVTEQLFKFPSQIFQPIIQTIFGGAVFMSMVHLEGPTISQNCSRSFTRVMDNSGSPEPRARAM